MSEYYKFIDESYIEKYKKSYVYVNDVQISNPSAETFLMAGIKPLVVEPEPEYDRLTQYIYPYYEDGERVITQKWQVEDIPDNEVIDDESVAET